MLSPTEALKLIRQAEINNMDTSEEECLKNWAIQARTNCILLELMFDGYLEINTMINEPSFTLTSAGGKLVGSNNLDDLIEMFECYLDEPYEEDEDEDEDEEFDEAIMALGNTAEEIKLKVQVLQTLCKRLGIETG